MVDLFNNRKFEDLKAEAEVRIGNEITAAVKLAKEGAGVGKSTAGLRATFDTLKGSSPELIAEFITDDPSVMQLIDVAQEVKDGNIDEDTILEVLGQDGTAYEFLPDEFKGVSKYVEAAVKGDASVLENIADLEGLLDDADFSADFGRFIPAAGAQGPQSLGPILKGLRAPNLSGIAGIGEVIIDTIAGAFAKFPLPTLRTRIKEADNGGEPLALWEQLMAVMGDSSAVRLIEDPDPKLGEFMVKWTSGEDTTEFVNTVLPDGKVADRVNKAAEKRRENLVRRAARYTDGQA